MIDISSPMYAKFSLHTAPDIYPAGGHLDATAVELSRERVRPRRRQPGPVVPLRFQSRGLRPHFPASLFPRDLLDF